MFYEWSQSKRLVGEFANFKLGDEVYFPHPTKKQNLKGKIVRIVIDEAAPRKEMSFQYIIIKTGLDNFFKKYKINSLKYISSDYKTNFNFKRFIEDYK